MADYGTATKLPEWVPPTTIVTGIGTAIAPVHYPINFSLLSAWSTSLHKIWQTYSIGGTDSGIYEPIVGQIWPRGIVDY